MKKFAPLLLKLFLVSCFLFAAYQLHSALLFGEIKFGRLLRWISYSEEPFRFLFGVVMYAIGAAAFATLLVLAESSD